MIDQWKCRFRCYVKDSRWYKTKAAWIAYKRELKERAEHMRLADIHEQRAYQHLREYERLKKK